MPSQPKQGRVLIIDDQDATRYVFRRILQSGGFEVIESVTGHEGLTAALSAPDLIIADVNLPDMLGYDVCRRLKANPTTQSIPVLQISASFVSDESKVQALNGGADSYLTQPVEPAVLLAQVNSLLRLRKAEALSHLTALHWQTTFDALSDGLALADESGIVIRANRTLVQLLGITTSEIEGKPLQQLFESCFDMPFADFAAHASGGSSVELCRGNQWFRVRYDVVQSHQHVISASVLVVHEITDQKKLQETLKLSERLATTGRLAHVIAHEINNPLEAMANLLYLAVQETEEESQERAYLEQASSELVRISQITKQVLAYHRESKQPVPTAANELLNGVLAMFRTHISGTGVELKTRIDCSSLIAVHPGEIRQVLSNLISNALDAMSDRRGTLSVRCFPSCDLATGRVGVRFAFSDNGPGIPDATLPRIFDAFYTTKETKGSGVGLWLSAEVVGKHKGKIRVRTRTEGPYRGCLFDVFIPMGQRKSQRSTAAMANVR